MFLINYLGSRNGNTTTKSSEEPPSIFSPNNPINSTPTTPIEEANEKELSFSEKTCISNSHRNADYVYKVIIVGDRYLFIV